MASHEPRGCSSGQSATKDECVPAFKRNASRTRHRGDCSRGHRFTPVASTVLYAASRGGSKTCLLRPSIATFTLARIWRRALCRVDGCGGHPAEGGGTPVPRSLRHLRPAAVVLAHVVHAPHREWPSGLPLPRPGSAPRPDPRGKRLRFEVAVRK